MPSHGAKLQIQAISFGLFFILKSYGFETDKVTLKGKVTKPIQ